MTSRIASKIEKITLALGFLLTLYLAASTVYLFQDVSVFQATFVAGIVVLSALLYLQKTIEHSNPAKSLHFVSRVVFSVIILVISIICTTYIIFNAVRLQTIQPFIEDRDLLVGWFLVGDILILTMIHWGKLFAGIVASAIAYFFLGHLIPLPLIGHSYYDVRFVMSYIGMNVTEGFFTFTGFATDNIYFLVLFTAVLLAVGIPRLFIEIGKAAGRHIKGGAAFPAIIGSSMVGSVMGQAVSNIMLTGQLTIPMMIKHGFRPSTAGAIEAVASPSGQLLPPILGLAAFIIAAFLNIPYIDVALKAVYPALLYVFGITISILVSARRQNLGYLTEAIDPYIIVRLTPTFLVPFIVVILLLLLYYSPSLAGLIGIAAILILSFFQGKKLRPSFRDGINGFREGLNILTLLCLLIVAK